VRWLERRRIERPTRARVPGPSAPVWLALLLLALVWLTTLLVAAANPPGCVHGGWLERAWLTLRDSPLALTIGAFLGLIGVVYCMRRLMLRRHAWRPGPIEVPDFLAGEAADAPVPALSMLFRERLAAVQLTAPNAFPTSPEPADFLQLLTSATQTPANVLGTIAGLLVSMLPKSAYRVHGLLVQRPGRDPFGVVVQVVTAPRYASQPLFLWGASWDSAVERAAYAVASYLLPRTRDCLKPPWTRWRGLELPQDLVGHGTRASEATRERRYDEALAAYFDAIELDPRNLELRFEVGLLQEKLALWLDAYATYDELIELAARPSWRNRRVRRVETRVKLLARYRKAVLLSFGERLADQWGRRDPPADNELRRKERRALVTRLRPVFEADLGKLERKLLGPDEAERTRNRKQQPKPSIVALKEILECSEGLSDPRQQVLLRELFAHIAQRDLRKLGIVLLLPTRRRHAAAAGLTRRSVLVAADLAGLRVQYIRVLLEKQTDVPRRCAIDKTVRKRMRPWAKKDWQAAYNTACTYAVALLPDTVAVKPDGSDGTTTYTPKERRHFAKRAGEQLGQALSQLDSSGLAGRRAWIVSQDPDLAALRQNRRFAELEARYFPSHRSAPSRPANVHRLEIARYATRLLRLTAHALSDAWREREADWSANGGPGDVLLLQWLDEEHSAVEHFVAAATQHRHWQTRASALQALRSWALTHGRSLGPIAYPDYGDHPLEQLDGPLLDAAANASRQALVDAMRSVDCRRAKVIVGGNEVEHHTAWLRAVKAAARNLDGVTLCRERALWWERLGDTLPLETGTPLPPPPLLTGPHKHKRLRLHWL
jgi:hypothetical protein